MKIFIFNRFTILLYLLFFSVACIQENNCPDCFTPPESLQIRILDKNTSEDLIYNGTYHQDSIQIKYYIPDGEQIVEYQVYTDSVMEQSVLVSYQISWESSAGFKEFFMYLDSTTTDTLYLNVEEKHSECCTYFEWVNFEINGAEPEFDLDNFYYILEK